MANVDWLGLAGFFIVFEAGISILASQDQRPVSNAGRTMRLLIGAGILIFE